MVDTLTPVLSDNWDTDRSWTLSSYESGGGYQALSTALGQPQDDVIQQVKDSGLRGRGGAGFPTGMKWGFIPQGDGKPHYLVVNADESEPGTCKDIPLMMANPHVLVEGVIISSYAIRANHAFIYCRGEVLHVIRRLRRAVEEAYLAGHLGKNIHGSGYDLELVIHAGAGAYICGEETALLDSLEGRRGQPRLRPPFPAVAGLYASPTVINNVESIASVPSIVANGADWFSGMGTEKSKGFGFFSLSGHVTRPGQYEAPLGITLRELLDLAGGVRNGRQLKFWTPGGSSTPILTAEHLDVPLDFEGIAGVGSMLGTRALQIFDDTTSVVRAVTRWTEFYKHESCGKCTPCREGTWWLVQTLKRIEAGQGQDGDIETLVDLCDNILGRSFCALGDGATSPITSAIQYFREEFEAGMHTPATELFPYEASSVFAGVNRMTTEIDASTKTVTLTIDDVEVTVPEGTLVIRAAEQIGVQIPRFCDHPLLDPVGACRQCLVDVPDAGNGRPLPKPQASCTLPVAPGMVVRSQHSSPVADKAQQGNMEFLLINHPLDCPVCDKGGECPLQNQAMSNGRGESRFVETKRTFLKPINISAQILLDRERCVLCARCTRFSEQIAGDPFIALIERGALQQVGIYEKEPFESYFSGNTVQICPVGALTSAAYRFRSRPFDLISTPSVCEHCSSGCSLRTDHRRGKVTRRLAGNDPSVNEEWNCDKGRFAFRSTTLEDRLTRPMVRDEDSGEMRPASWPEAFAVAAKGLAAAQSAVGVLAGGRLTSEDAYAYGKFARASLGTNDIDFRARPHSEEEASFLAAHVATRAGVTFGDLEHANAVVLVGFEAEEEAPIVFLRLRKGVMTHGTRVFSVASHSSRGLQKLDGTLLPATPGQEAAAIAAVAIHPEVALDGGGVILVGERMAASPGALSAVAELAATTGAKLAWIPRRAGERGAIEMGLLPNLLPGSRPLSDAAARVDLAAVWGLDVVTSTPGRDTGAILAAATAGDIKALVVGGVEIDDLPDPAAALAALDAAEFVISLEVRASAITERADVILPVAPMAERSGSFVNWEGRLRPFEQVLTSSALSDIRVLAGISEELGRPLGFRTVAEVQAEARELGPWDGDRASFTAVAAPTGSGRSDDGSMTLSTWRMMIDDARSVDGEPYLLATGRRSVAVVSAADLDRLSVRPGDLVKVSTDAGSVTVPARLGDIAEGVVWLPGNNDGVSLNRDLQAGPGSPVLVEAVPADETAVVEGGAA